MACGPCGDALRGQGELRGISISPFAPLTPTPLKTTRDTLDPPLCRLRATSPLAGEKAGNVPNDFALRGAFGGWGYGGYEGNVRTIILRMNPKRGFFGEMKKGGGRF